jgi:hypothetical protein
VRTFFPNGADVFIEPIIPLQNSDGRMIFAGLLKGEKGKGGNKKSALRVEG